MIKKFYIFALLFLVGTTLASIAFGTFDALTIIAVSLVTVGLVYGFALWAVLVNPEGDLPGSG